MKGIRTWQDQFEIEKCDGTRKQTDHVYADARVAMGIHHHHYHHLLNWVWPVGLMDEITTVSVAMQKLRCCGVIRSLR